MHNGSLRLLLVEDSPAEARLLEAVLFELAGPFELVCAECLGEAECELGRGVFDAVLLDLTLPDSRGLPTLNRINAAAPHLPILILTGLDDEALATEAIRRALREATQP